MAVTITFPHETDASSKDVPMWVTFYSANYSTWAAYRTPQAVTTDWNYRIVLPYPTNFNTLNRIPYTNSASIQMRGVETALRSLGLSRRSDSVGNGSTPKGFGGQYSPSVDKDNQGRSLDAIGRMAAQSTIASGELFESFMTGGNVFRFDHTETVLKPGCRRTHVFEFNMISKTPDSARAASRIANAFQANAHPGAFTRSIYTMTHPDIWVFGISSTPGDSESQLDGQGLTSVLERVDINRSPIQNIPYNILLGGARYPLAINLKLYFTELEPALNLDGENLIIRSQKEP
jgi:hypothetical protein